MLEVETTQEHEAQNHEVDALSDAEILEAITSDIDEAKFDDLRFDIESFYDSYDAININDTYGSDHKCRDVLSTTEQMKALLTQTFSSSRDVVTFSALHREGEQNAKLRTSLANHIFYTQNDGQQILTNLFHDGLVCRNGFIKGYYKKEEKRKKHEFQGITQEQFYQIAAQNNVEILEATQETTIVQGPNPQTGEVMEIEQQIFSGVFEQIEMRDRIIVENVKPENLVVDDDATSLKDYETIKERSIMTRSDLLEMGFDPDVVYELQTYHSKTEDEVRNDEDDKLQHSLANTLDREKVEVFEVYKYIDIEGRGISQLYQFFYSGQHLLSKELVESHPYFMFRPFPKGSGAFYGSCLPELVGDIQDSLTGVVREVINNVALTNTSRSTVISDLVDDMAALEDNEIGSLIAVQSHEAINPIPTPQVNSATFALKDSLEGEIEKNSGSTKMASGIDPSVVNNNNPASLIENLTNNSTRRTMQIAKLFAESTFKPLFVYLTDLAISYYEGQVSLPTRDGFMPVNPAQLAGDTRANVKAALTSDEGSRQAMQLLSVHQLLIASPVMANNYGPQQQYNLFNRVFELTDIDNFDSLLLSPETPEYQQAVQTQQQQAQQAQQAQAQQAQLNNQLLVGQIQAIKDTVQIEMAKLMQRDKEAQEKIEIEEQKIIADLEIKNRELEIDEDYKAGTLYIKGVETQENINKDKIEVSQTQ